MVRSIDVAKGNLSTPAIDKDDTMYVSTSDGFLIAVAVDGAVKWSTNPGGGDITMPAIDRNGTVYVGASDGNLYAISPDGDLLWAISTGAQIQWPPTIGDDGTIYVGSDSGKLNAIHGSAGLSDGPWPMYRHDARLSGIAETTEN